MALATNVVWSSVTAAAVASIATSTATPPSGVNLCMLGLASTVPLANVSGSFTGAYSILGGGPTSGLYLYLAYNNLATPFTGTHTEKITANLSTTGNVSIVPLGASGVASSGALDQQSAIGSGSSTSPNTAAVTTLTANEILVAVTAVVTGSNITWTAGSGYTNLQSNTVGTGSKIPSMIEAQIVAATGSYSGAATISPSGSWVQLLATFGDTATGGGGGGGGGGTGRGTLLLLHAGS